MESGLQKREFAGPTGGIQKCIMRILLVNTEVDNYSLAVSTQMADRLREAIRASGLSALALSRLTGVAQPRISEFLNGRDIKLTTAQKLADHFGLKLDSSRKSKS